MMTEKFKAIACSNLRDTMEEGCYLKQLLKGGIERNHPL
jgi:hypothetical protein